MEPSPLGACLVDRVAQELADSDVGSCEQRRGNAPFDSAAGGNGIADAVRREGPAGLFQVLGGVLVRRQRRRTRSLMNIEIGTPRRLSQMESSTRRQPERQVGFEPVEPDHEQPAPAM